MTRPFDTFSLREQADETIRIHEDAYPPSHECPQDVYGLCLAYRHATQLKAACEHIEWMNGDLATAQDPDVALATWVFDEMEEDRD